MKFRKRQRIVSNFLGTILSFCMLFIVVGSQQTVYSVLASEQNAAEWRQQQSSETGGLGDRLDGDYAYISEVGILMDQTTKSGFAVRTGTAPWDEETEKNIAGNDTTDLDNTVRSFDIVSYTTYFRSKMRDDAAYSGHRTGTLHFEFIVPGESNMVQYEIDSMGWLTAKAEAQYEVTEAMYQGQICQVLQGSYLWEPNEDNPVAIGESYQELNVVLRVLAMHNGETLQPYFTFWLEGNEVQQDREQIVTGSDTICSAHGEIEYKTIEAPEINVTAAPRYNIQLKSCDPRAQYINFFDFSTGNKLAQNQNAGTVYGRVNVLGITLQIYGKSPQHGLRGCEIPDGKPITFDLELASEYIGTDGNTYDTSDRYQPLLWSLDANIKSNEQGDGREIAGSYKFAAGGAPMNKGTAYESCKDGGRWTAVQEGTTLQITVTEYQVDLNQLPYADGNVSPGIYTYYDPMTTQHYWDIQQACFSAGECWIVQPFYDKDETYVVDEYATGTFTMSVTDQNLKATGESGQLLDNVSDNKNQMEQSDDHAALPMALEQPGTIDQSVNYQQYGKIEYGSSLTDGCFENGKDWIVAGGQLNIQEMLKQNSAEGMYTGVAYDDLIKFDDQFFELEEVKKGSSAGMQQMTDQFLYGAKSDKSGWNHQNLNPDEEGYDLEMMQATADDLIFFSSLEELRSHGYTCVAVLWEARGLASAQSTNCYIGLQGKVKDTVQSNQVYMVTHCARAWNKQDVAKDIADFYNKDIAALTDDDYISYMKSKEFPTRADSQQSVSYTEYPDAFWVNEYGSRDGLTNYKKAEYNESGYVSGSAGLSYGDSCLVVSYATQISKDTMQQSGTGSAQASKRAYDMDSNQRVADYVLKPSVKRTVGESQTEDMSIKTTLYIKDVLPKGLHYIYGSSYLGGTYTQRSEGKQGQIENGQKLDPEITENEDGTTTLVWTLKNVVFTNQEIMYFDPIYYSCEIGTVGDEKTDVINNQQLLNQVYIWGSDEQKRDFTEKNGNMAAISIQVSKNNSVSLAKIADKAVVEPGESIGAVLNVGNNADNTMNLIAMDSLPYDGDEVGSSFDGDCQVTEFRILTPKLLDKLRIYYTDDVAQRGKTSMDYVSSDFQSEAGWKLLTADSDTGVVTLPDNFCPTAIAVVGELPGQKTLKMHITMSVPNGKSGDYVINRLTRDSLESDSRTYIYEEEDPPVTGVNEHTPGKISYVSGAAGVMVIILLIVQRLRRKHR